MPVPSLWTRFYSGLVGFLESYFNSGATRRDTHAFSAVSARRLRYAVYWSHYEGNIYRRMHPWAAPLKSAYQLYAYTRTIYSPAYRLGEFWASHVMGGNLDPDAGNGVDRPSAIPIVTENEELRLAIAKVWKLSNWQLNNQTWVRYGAVMGDTACRIVDDEARRAVYLEVVHPSDVAYVRCDPFGNVKEYVIEELRPDPRGENESGVCELVLYREECTKNGVDVTFRTYLDGDRPEDLYDWRDYPDDDAPRIGPEWTMPYGFVPLVVTKHRDMGPGSGWPEMHPALSKFHELDDMGSKLNDQIRKVVESPWFFTGVSEANLTIRQPGPTEADPEPGRETFPTLSSPDAAAHAVPLVMPLDVAAVSAHVGTIKKSIYDDFPELIADDPTADVSGESRRVARQQTEAKVVSRRAPYDDSHKRALQMAISIGGLRGYDGFQAFPPGSYEAGRLDFSIGERPVFALDPMDRLKEDQAQATVVQTLVLAGMPLASALAQVGMTEDQIAVVMDAKAKEEDAALESIRRQQVAHGGAIDGANVSPTDVVNGVTP